jgi:hypothetical protein
MTDRTAQLKFADALLRIAKKPAPEPIPKHELPPEFADIFSTIFGPNFGTVPPDKKDPPK